MPQSGLGSMQGLFWTHETNVTNEQTKPYIEAACCLKMYTAMGMHTCSEKITFQAKITKQYGNGGG